MRLKEWPGLTMQRATPARRSSKGERCAALARHHDGAVHDELLAGLQFDLQRHGGIFFPVCLSKR
jgi:hypothetical protein